MPRQLAFTDKQLQCLKTPTKTWNIWCGAVRSGKSFATIMQMPLKINKHYDEPCLIVAKTLAMVEKNVLSVLRNQYTDRFIGFIKSTADGRRVVNIFGKEIDCVGANDARSAAKIHGTEYGYVYGDEVVLWDEAFFTMLQSRLSLADSEFDGTCNPESPSHYLKQFMDSPTFDGNCFEFTLWDNPYLPKHYIERLENEYRGTIYYDRFILGKWTSCEGQVFPLFRRDKHYITPDKYTELFNENMGKIRYCIVGGDGATTNDSTALVPLMIFSDGHACVGDIFYHNPKESGQLSNADLIPYIRQWYDDIIRKYALDRGGVRFYTAVDCAAADLVLTMRKNLPTNYNITAMTKKSITQTTDVVNNAFARDLVHILDVGGTYNYVRRRFESGVSQLVIDLERMIWAKGNETYDASVPNDVADAFRYAVNTYYNNPLNMWDTPDFGQ